MLETDRLRNIRTGLLHEDNSYTALVAGVFPSRVKEVVVEGFVKHERHRLPTADFCLARALIFDCL
jgi:hypothetical protein